MTINPELNTSIHCDPSPTRNTDTPPCIVCGAPPTLHTPLVTGQELRRYRADDLVFAWPMEPPAQPVEPFAKAYTGKIAGAQMEIFHHRLIGRGGLLRSPAAPARRIVGYRTFLSQEHLLAIADPG